MVLSKAETHVSPLTPLRFQTSRTGSALVRFASARSHSPSTSPLGSAYPSTVLTAITALRRSTHPRWMRTATGSVTHACYDHLFEFCVVKCVCVCVCVCVFVVEKADNALVGLFLSYRSIGGLIMYNDRYRHLVDETKS
eukprot:Rmarinus@m.26716